MSFNINRFKSDGLREGGARPTQFEVELTVPAPVLTNETNLTERARFLIKAAELPPMQIAPINVFYFGRSIKVAGDRDYPDWNITVLNDADFALRKLFEKWSNMINTIVSNRIDPAVAPLSYKADLYVTQYKNTGAVAAKYKIVGAWPIVVDRIGLDHGAVNSIEEFSVNISYDWWEPDDPNVYNPVLADDSQRIR